MMASIEARMRRLSKITHQTARQVTALKNSIQDGHQMEVKGMKYLSLRDTSPVVTRPEHNLPEWKFFNQEANSIFRNMRVVEKWLQGQYSAAKEITLFCIRFLSPSSLPPSQMPKFRLPNEGPS